MNVVLLLLLHFTAQPKNSHKSGYFLMGFERAEVSKVSSANKANVDGSERAELSAPPRTRNEYDEKIPPSPP